ncbi:MAG: hypothetical protein IMX01_03355 [Limnochordaceae bacterium]|nr:hypothetical protein [Limnochordaceae bacterium]
MITWVAMVVLVLVLAAPIRATDETALTPATSPRSGSLPAGMTIDGQVGFDGQFRPGSWSPVRLTVTYHAENAIWQGYIGLTITRPISQLGLPNTLTYRAPVVVASPARLQFDFLLPLLNSYDSLQWQLWDEHDRLQAAGPVPLLTASADQAIWLIWREQAFNSASLAWAAAGAVDQTGTSPSLPGSAASVTPPPARIQFVTDPQMCPTNGLAYDGVDLLLLDRFPWQRLPPAAVQAVRAWVQTGGILLVTAAARAATSGTDWLHWPAAQQLAAAPIVWTPAGEGWIGFASWRLDNPPWSQSPGSAHAWLQPQVAQRVSRRPITPLVPQKGRPWMPPLDAQVLELLLAQRIPWPQRASVGLGALAYLAALIAVSRLRPRRLWERRARLVMALLIWLVGTGGAAGWAYSWQRLGPHARTIELRLGQVGQTDSWVHTYWVTPNPQPRTERPLPATRPFAAGVLPVSDIYPAGEPTFALTGQSNDPFWEVETRSDGAVWWRGRSSVAALVTHQLVPSDRFALEVSLQSDRNLLIRNQSDHRFVAGILASPDGSLSGWTLPPRAQDLHPLPPAGRAIDLQELLGELDRFTDSLLRQDARSVRALSLEERELLPALCRHLATWIPALWPEGPVQQGTPPPSAAHTSPPISPAPQWVRPVVLAWEWGGNEPTTVYIYRIPVESGIPSSESTTPQRRATPL